MAYKVPLGKERIELRVSNSHFIATLGPATSVEEARAFIDDIRREFHDATHNVPAFVIGHGSSTTMHCSDDGEPSGTAGKPALAVLQGSGLGDVVVVVTRYFGGSKLGTGGLVRAYSDAVRQVLERVQSAEKVVTHLLLLAVPYNLLEQTRLLVSNHNGIVLEEAYAAEVTLKVRMRVAAVPGFQEAIRGISSGRVEAEIIAANQETILPSEDQS